MYLPLEIKNMVLTLCLCFARIA